MWRFNFFAALIFPARTFHNTALLSYEPEPSRNLQLKEKQRTNPKSKPSRSLHLHEILQKGGKTMWRFNFFAALIFPARTFHNTALLSYEPEPSRNLQLKEKQRTNPKLKPSRSLHLNEILQKGGKTMWRFNFFAALTFPARTFHNTALLSYEPEPSRNLQLKEKQRTNPKSKPSRSLHLHEILQKGGKPCGVLTFLLR